MSEITAIGTNQAKILTGLKDKIMLYISRVQSEEVEQHDTGPTRHF